MEIKTRICLLPTINGRVNKTFEKLYEANITLAPQDEIFLGSGIGSTESFNGGASWSNNMTEKYYVVTADIEVGEKHPFSNAKQVYDLLEKDGWQPKK